LRQALLLGRQSTGSGCLFEGERSYHVNAKVRRILIDAAGLRFLIGDDLAAARDGGRGKGSAGQGSHIIDRTLIALVEERASQPQSGRILRGIRCRGCFHKPGA
jgi:hypothetical protein